MTKIKTLIAAMDAESLAVEAKKRAKVKSKNKHGGDDIPDLVRKAFEKNPTQAQVKQALLKEKWRPPGYISVLELLDLAGAYKFKEWSGRELDVLANPPKCLQVSHALDLKNTADLIADAFSNDFIKEGIRQPPSMSGDNSGVWQDAWLYLHRVGKYNGAKTKEDAIDGWLEEASFIVPENSQYNSARHKVEQVQKFLRDALCTGKIKAARLGADGLEDVVRSYWLGNDSADVFDVQNPSQDLLFEHKSVQRIIAISSKPEDFSANMLMKVSSGSEVTAAANVVYAECRSRGDKLGRQELHELMDRILKRKGKVLPKSWYKTQADIPLDLRRQPGEHGKCSLINEDWPKSESK
ncbi:MAG: hypothetical protein ACT4OY_01545 [Alphaproteobacteria bacterium]